MSSLPGETCICDWLDNPNPASGITFVTGGDETFVPYPELARQILGFAAAIAEHVDRGDRVCISLSEPHSFVIALFATFAVGCIAVPLPPPMALQRDEDYLPVIAGMIEDSRPRAAVVNSSTAHAMSLRFPSVKILVHEMQSGSIASATAQRARVHADRHVVMLQYTSGSTMTPRGVVVDCFNLTENAEMMRNWLGVTSADCMGTWLPTHHDMGLTGALITPTLFQNSIVVTTPSQFVRRPGRWLALVERRGVTISGAPPAGFRLMLRAGSGGVQDLSCWRVAICGAEPIDVLLLREFIEAFGSARFSPRSPTAAYGMAEATLTISGGRPGAQLRAARLYSQPMKHGGTVAVDEVVPLSRVPLKPTGDNASWIASCGLPLGGLSVDIRDERGAVCSDGTVGEIWIQGSSVARGYWGHVEAADQKGNLNTGDAGFMIDNEIYVVGRIADRVKVRGQSLYAEDIEVRLASRLHLRSDSLLVFPRLDVRGQALFVLVEARTCPSDPQRIRDAIQSIVGDEINTELYWARPGSIKRTTSGKVRRRATGDSVLQHEIATVRLQGS